MKILITGFDPFGPDSLNSSWTAVSQLDDTIGAHRVCTLKVPTAFHQSWEVLSREIEEKGPDAIICTGQASHRNRLSLEKVAINYIDARIPDNLGQQPLDVPIQPAGPDGYFTSLPIREMEEALREESIPSEISYSAGSYVCNYLFYQVRHHCPDLLSGFVHVPRMPEQILTEKGSPPYMPLDMIRRGLETIVKTL